MENLPPWLTTAITSVILAVIGYFLGRRVTNATAGEKDATALEIVNRVAADLARQVEAFTDEIPVWRQKIAAESDRADKAEALTDNAREIKEQALIIVEEMSHISYLRDPDAEETTVERRLRRVKTAAAKIAAFEI